MNSSIVSNTLVIVYSYKVGHYKLFKYRVKNKKIKCYSNTFEIEFLRQSVSTDKGLQGPAKSFLIPIKFSVKVL